MFIAEIRLSSDTADRLSGSLNGECLTSYNVGVYSKRRLWMVAILIMLLIARYGINKKDRRVWNEEQEHTTRKRDTLESKVDHRNRPKHD